MANQTPEEQSRSGTCASAYYSAIVIPVPLGIGFEILAALVQAGQ